MSYYPPYRPRTGAPKTVVPEASAAHYAYPGDLQYQSWLHRHPGDDRQAGMSQIPQQVRAPGPDPRRSSHTPAWASPFGDPDDVDSPDRRSRSRRAATEQTYEYVPDTPTRDALEQVVPEVAKQDPSKTRQHMFRHLNSKWDLHLEKIQRPVPPKASSSLTRPSAPPAGECIVSKPSSSSQTGVVVDTNKNDKPAPKPSRQEPSRTWRPSQIRDGFDDSELKVQPQEKVKPKTKERVRKASVEGQLELESTEPAKLPPIAEPVKHEHEDDSDDDFLSDGDNVVIVDTPVEAEAAFEIPKPRKKFFSFLLDNDKTELESSSPAKLDLQSTQARQQMAKKYPNLAQMAALSRPKCGPEPAATADLADSDFDDIGDDRDSIVADSGSEQEHAEALSDSGSVVPSFEDDFEMLGPNGDCDFGTPLHNSQVLLSTDSAGSLLLPSTIDYGSTDEYEWTSVRFAADEPEMMKQSLVSESADCSLPPSSLSSIPPPVPPKRPIVAPLAACSTNLNSSVGLSGPSSASNGPSDENENENSSASSVKAKETARKSITSSGTSSSRRPEATRETTRRSARARLSRYGNELINVSGFGSLDSYPEIPPPFPSSREVYPANVHMGNMARNQTTQPSSRRAVLAAAQEGEDAAVAGQSRRSFFQSHLDQLTAARARNTGRGPYY